MKELSFIIMFLLCLLVGLKMIKDTDFNSKYIAEAWAHMIGYLLCAVSLVFLLFVGLMLT